MTGDLKNEKIKNLIEEKSAEFTRRMSQIEDVASKMKLYEQMLAEE